MMKIFFLEQVPLCFGFGFIMMLIRPLHPLNKQPFIPFCRLQILGFLWILPIPVKYNKVRRKHIPAYLLENKFKH